MRLTPERERCKCLDVTLYVSATPSGFSFLWKTSLSASSSKKWPELFITTTSKLRSARPSK